MSHILIAEDSATQAAQMRILLKSAGFDARVVANGVEALEALAEREPQAVLTDLDMPEMNGLELVMAVRRDYPQIPVILMTAYGSEEIATQALQNGAASYVPKKNLARDLVETLQDVLAVARAGREEAQLVEYQTATEAQFLLPNVSPPVMAIVAFVQDSMAALKLGDESDRIRLGVALDTAINNAIYYGNLELTPDQLQSAHNLEHAGTSYYQMLHARGNMPPYRDRKVHVAMRMSRHEVRCVIQHEGAGFDAQSLHDSADHTELDGDRARGWLLVKSFMGEVSFNAAGNEIILSKHYRL